MSSLCFVCGFKYLIVCLATVSAFILNVQNEKFVFLWERNKLNFPKPDFTAQSLRICVK